MGLEEHTGIYNHHDVAGWCIYLNWLLGIHLLLISLTLTPQATAKDLAMFFRDVYAVPTTKHMALLKQETVDSMLQWRNLTNDWTAGFAELGVYYGKKTTLFDRIYACPLMDSSFGGLGVYYGTLRSFIRQNYPFNDAIR